jgi:CheY-like chemotaxis protein
LVLASSVACPRSEEGGSRFAARLTKPVKTAQLYDVLASILSRRAAAAAEKPAQPPSALEAENRARLRILLAEDNPINQKVAIKMIDKLGYRADAVANGKEVLEALEKIPYDVILMDCQMPVMDGYQTARRIRMQEWQDENEPIRIIAMTANAMQGDRERCIESGMDDYLGKPVRIGELQEALARCRPLHPEPAATV